MQDLKLILTKFIVKRRLEGGEFTYVLRPRDQSITGKKPILNLLKENQNIYSKLKEECEWTESDEELDSQLLKIIPLLPYEDTVPAIAKTKQKKKGKGKPKKSENKDEDMDVDGDDDNDGWDTDFAVPVHEYKRTVLVTFPAVQSTFEECEAFLKEVDPNAVMKRGITPKKSSLKKYFRLTFQSDEDALKFSTKEHMFKEKPLKCYPFRSSALNKKVIQAFQSDLSIEKLKICYWLDENEASQSQIDKYIFIDTAYSAKHCDLDKLKEESGFKSIRKIVQGDDKCRGYLVEFSNKKSAEKFFTENIVQKADAYSNMFFNRVRDFKNHSEDFLKENNLGEDGDNPEKKIVFVTHMETDTIKKMFPSAVSVTKSKNGTGRFGCGLFTIVEFANAKDASEADGQSEGLNCMNHMLMKDYFAARKAIPESLVTFIRKKINRHKELLENKASNVDIEVTDEEIKVVGQWFIKGQKVQKQEIQAKIERSKLRSAQTQTTETNKIASRRKALGKTDFDHIVVVTGLKPKNPTLGIPSDMDICNYFIHNHKNVDDVKFATWMQNSAFVKFNSREAADTFAELDYVMFFGSEVGRTDVYTYVKNKSPGQKDEVSRMLIGKKFQAPAALQTATGGEFYVELAGFTNKSDDIRELFMSKLNLSTKDVGKTVWEEHKDEAIGLRAKFNVKIPENAVNHLIKRWNDMEISVEGQDISAKFWVPTKGNKRKGDGSLKKLEKKQKF